MHAMATERPRYFAYLLRLWQVATNGEVVWRVSIEDPHTGERRGFANLDRLFEFLAERTYETNRDEIQANNQTIDANWIASGSCKRSP